MNVADNIILTKLTKISSQFRHCNLAELVVSKRDNLLDFTLQISIKIRQDQTQFEGPALVKQNIRNSIRVSLSNLFQD
jgi:hypothetical protein